MLGGIASVAGTRATFGGVAVLAGVLLVVAARTPAAAPAEPQPLSTLGAALRTRRILASVWFVSLPALLFGTLSVLAPLRLDVLGFGALAIGATWLVAAGLEAPLSPLLGHVSDRVGRLLPIRAGLAASTVVLALLPWPRSAYLLAALVVCAAAAFGSFWTPAMSLMADAAEARSLDYGYAFALMNLAWAPGQALGAAGSGALAAATRDAVPYLTLAGVCALTLAALWRSGPSS